MNIEKEYTTRRDQSSHSPEDDSHQGPTRAVEEAPVRDSVEDRRGSVGDPTVGGSSYAVSKTIERRWKGRESAASKRGRHVVPAQPNQNTWIDRLEEVGKDAIRRSSVTTDVVFDKITDTLSSWGTSLERATAPGDRRQSWSEKALSFFRYGSASASSSSSPADDGKQAKPPYQSQRDVECLGSDDHYDDAQASFRLEPESIVIRDPPRPLQKQRRRSHNPSASAAQPARTHRRRNTIHEANDPTHWFDTDPNSARVTVPPLSTNPPEGPVGTTTQTTELLYDKETPRSMATPAGDHPANTLDPNQRDRMFHVVESKKSPSSLGDLNADNMMDSDFENWKPHPATHKKRM